MYSSQIDFFPAGATGNATETKGHALASLLRAPHGQVWHTESPTYTVTISGRLRKEYLAVGPDAPPWVTLATITEATSATDRLFALTKRFDEVKVEVSGWSGTGKVFVVVSGENIGGQR